LSLRLDLALDNAWTPVLELFGEILDGLAAFLAEPAMRLWRRLRRRAR
jgi:hypothetical protein